MSNDDFNNLFLRENLRRLRLKNGLTTTAIAKIINKSRPAYASYEAGFREISIHDLVTLSGFYHVSIDELLGNPFSNRNEKELTFRTYEVTNNEIKPTVQQILSTINDDVIVLKRDENTVDFYWRTQLNQPNKVMLFEYNNRFYTSKVYQNKDKSGFFFEDDQPQYFNKVHAESLVFIGVFASTLKKDFSIPNFF